MLTKPVIAASSGDIDREGLSDLLEVAVVVCGEQNGQSWWQMGSLHPLFGLAAGGAGIGGSWGCWQLPQLSVVSPQVP